MMNVGLEVHEIQEACRRSNELRTRLVADLENWSGTSLDDLRRFLQTNDRHILHFSGHGAYDWNTHLCLPLLLTALGQDYRAQPEIMLEDSVVREMRALLDLSRLVSEPRLSLLMLMCCDSACMGKKLVHAVPNLCAVAWLTRVDNKACIAFSQRFYHILLLLVRTRVDRGQGVTYGVFLDAFDQALVTMNTHRMVMIDPADEDDLRAGNFVHPEESPAGMPVFLMGAAVALDAFLPGMEPVGVPVSPAPLSSLQRSHMPPSPSPALSPGVASVISGVRVSGGNKRARRESDLSDSVPSTHSRVTVVSRDSSAGYVTHGSTIEEGEEGMEVGGRVSEGYDEDDAYLSGLDAASFAYRQSPSPSPASAAAVGAGVGGRAHAGLPLASLPPFALPASTAYARSDSPRESEVSMHTAQGSTGAWGGDAAGWGDDQAQHVYRAGSGVPTPGGGHSWTGNDLSPAAAAQVRPGAEQLFERHVVPVDTGLAAPGSVVALVGMSANLPEDYRETYRGLIRAPSQVRRRCRAVPSSPSFGSRGDATHLGHGIVHSHGVGHGHLEPHAHDRTQHAHHQHHQQALHTTESFHAPAGIRVGSSYRGSSALPAVGTGGGVGVSSTDQSLLPLAEAAVQEVYGAKLLVSASQLEGMAADAASLLLRAALPPAQSQRPAPPEAQLPSIHQLQPAASPLRARLQELTREWDSLGQRAEAAFLLGDEQGAQRCALQQERLMQQMEGVRRELQSNHSAQPADAPAGLPAATVPTPAHAASETHAPTQSFTPTGVCTASSEEEALRLIMEQIASLPQGRKRCGDSACEEWTPDRDETCVACGWAFV